MAVILLILIVIGAVAVAISRPGTTAGSPPPAAVPGAATGLLPSGRQLTPQGTQVTLGNLPTGGAVTADGKFLWTVSAGFSSNDVRIVDTAQHRVCQTLSLPGASGGIALDSVHRLAYISGLANSRWQPSKNSLPGAKGNDVLVYSWAATCGQARLLRVIPVPAQPGAPTVQAFPPPRPGLAGTVSSWPQKLAVSPDGTRLLVPLNLANAAAVVDLNHSDQVRYVPTGSYPFGAAIVPGGKIGLVTNEAAGTLSVIDLQRGTKLTDITVGPPLSHPQGVVVDAAGARAYVAISASDEVAVVDLKQRTVERTISVGRPAGLGTMPVALALDPAGDRLFVAESGADEIAAIRLPGGSPAPAPD
jgi:YVTN family beta-propeller protein